MEVLDLFIMKLLLSNPMKKYSILETARNLKKNYKSIYHAVQRLTKQKALKKQRIGHTDYCSVDLKGNIGIFCFVEAVIAGDFLVKNKQLKIIVNDILEKMRTPFYTMLIFGSYAKGKETKHSDIDILIIVDSNERAEETERVVHGIARLSPKPLHLTAVTYADFLDMLKSNDMNVAKQILGNHIIFNGYEEYYRMLAIANVV